MTAKIALALVASPFLMSAAPEIDFAPVPMFTYLQPVKMLMCGQSRGTGWYSRVTGLSSVNHVTSEPGCQIDTGPVQTVYSDGKLDYSSSHVDAVEAPFEVDCAGLIKGRQYIAVGFAHGLAVQRAVVVSPEADDLPNMQWDDSTTMVGTERLIPGMSGGPVIDAETGKVAGLVRGYNSFPGISYAVDVKLTPLCR